MNPKVLALLALTALGATACTDTLVGGGKSRSDTPSFAPSPAPALPTASSLGAMGPSAQIVPSPDNPSIVTYTFADIAPNCNWEAQLPGTYEDLTFLDPPYLAPCGGGYLAPSWLNSYWWQTTFPVRIQLPRAARSASTWVYDYNSEPWAVFTISALDAGGAVISSDHGVQDQWKYATVTGNFQTVRLHVAYNEWLFQFTVQYRDPATKDGCKNGGWQYYHFKNQGQCVSYMETGKDSRTD